VTEVSAALDPHAFRGDALVAWSILATKIGRTSETLKTWHRRFGVPAVIDPGGEWLGYQSWGDMVLASAMPGKAPNIAEVTRRWWSERGVKEVPNAQA
jgi:hypothetical protein